jgi:hypothetical protein
MNLQLSRLNYILIHKQVLFHDNRAHQGSRSDGIILSSAGKVILNILDENAQGGVGLQRRSLKARNVHSITVH